MPGASNAGLRYASWDTGIFNGDKKIDKLLDAYGWRGFGIYFFLCQQAYGLNGYYCEWGFDDGPTTARRMGGGVSSQAVEETVMLCLQVGLWDQGLFDRYGVLTSRGIQRRFLDAAKRRRSIPVYREYWLLDQNETVSLANCVVFLDLRNADADLRNADADLRNAPLSKKERKKETYAQCAQNETEKAQELFDTFWSSYPRKVAKPKARDKFLKLLKDGTSFDAIMKGLDRDKKSEQWRKDNGTFIPYPITWLNQERWGDEGIDLSAMGKPANSVEDDYELVVTESGEKLWRKKKRT